MSDFNWPEGATHHSMSGVFYRFSDEEWQFHTVNGWRTSDDWSHRKTAPESFTAKPTSWSGPQDGLPPIGKHVYVHDPEGQLIYGAGEDGEVLAHVENTAVVRMSYGLGCFTAKHLRTKEQLIQEQRETSIREIMDIADVDCRVTAARLVDSGFKREVV
jgi:hypothetical protein